MSKNYNTSFSSIFLRYLFQNILVYSSYEPTAEIDELARPIFLIVRNVSQILLPVTFTSLVVHYVQFQIFRLQTDRIKEQRHL